MIKHRLAVLVTLTLAACEDNIEPIPFEDEGRPSVPISDIDCFPSYHERNENQQLSFPLTVYVDDEMSIDDQHNVEVAIDAWNKALSYKLFRPPVVREWTGQDVHDVEPFGCGTVQITYFDESHRPGGNARWNECLGFVRITSDYTLNANIFIHELGHVLNLPHEEDRQSVMYKTAWSPEQEISEFSRCFVGLAIQEANEN